MDQAACGIVNLQLLPGQAVAARNSDRRVASAWIGIDLKCGDACGGRSSFFNRTRRVIDYPDAAGVVVGDVETTMNGVLSFNSFNSILGPERSGRKEIKDTKDTED
jgi:hypothetical protein